MEGARVLNKASTYHRVWRLGLWGTCVWGAHVWLHPIQRHPGQRRARSCRLFFLLKKAEDNNDWSIYWMISRDSLVCMWRKKKLFSTQCKTLLTIFTYTMLHLVYSPKFCIIIVSDFSWVLHSFKAEKSKAMVTQNLGWGGGGWVNKVH